jgi:D-glycero-D-manno-heptose 1,7-bisphosphate phosphatase
MQKVVPVLYLDIDGTVRQGKDDALGRFVNGPGDVWVFPEAVARMWAWKAGGGRIIGVSNQGGVALGVVSMRDMAAAMVETQRQCDGLFDRIAFCMHHPNAEHPEMARCWCRKPRPGLAIETACDLGRRYADECYPPYMALFVGDREEDRLCADALNVDFQWAAEWRS